MSTNLISSDCSPNSSDYVLATGARAVGRLLMLDDIYAPAGKRGILKAGLAPGMHVADFGCGVGAMTRNLAEMVGPDGSAMGIDLHESQLLEAALYVGSAVYPTFPSGKRTRVTPGFPTTSSTLYIAAFC